MAYGTNEFERLRQAMRDSASPAQAQAVADELADLLRVTGRPAAASVVRHWPGRIVRTRNGYAWECHPEYAHGDPVHYVL